MKATQPHYIACRDHLVSQEIFDLIEEVPGQLLRTHNAPLDPSSYYPESTYRSHQNTGQSLMDRVYQWAKALNTNGKLKWVLNTAVSDHPTHLDFGAGNGYFVQSVSTHGWNSYGVEPSPSARCPHNIKGSICFHPSVSCRMYSLMSLRFGMYWNTSLTI
jgi:hypothetical protein